MADSNFFFWRTPEQRRRVMAWLVVPCLIAGGMSAYRWCERRWQQAGSFHLPRNPNLLAIGWLPGTAAPTHCIAGRPLQTALAFHWRGRGILHTGLAPAAARGAPVNLGQRWAKSAGAPDWHEGGRLSPAGGFRPTGRGVQRIDYTLRCPQDPGVYVLGVEFVQEGVAWQSDVAAERQYIRQ